MRRRWMISPSFPNKKYVIFFPFAETSQELVRCHSYQCGWYHEECAVDPTSIAMDWYCSNECLQNGTYIYCMCHKRRGSKFAVLHYLIHAIPCRYWNENGGMSSGGELHQGCLVPYWMSWYFLSWGSRRSHFIILMIKQRGICLLRVKISDVWFCSDECRLTEAQRSRKRRSRTAGPIKADRISEYSKGLLFHGYQHRVFKTAVRQGDGCAMRNHARIQLLQFWNRKHIIYTQLTHNFLVGSLFMQMLDPSLATLWYVYRHCWRFPPRDSSFHALEPDCKTCGWCRSKSWNGLGKWVLRQEF